MTRSLVLGLLCAATLVGCGGSSSPGTSDGSTTETQSPAATPPAGSAENSPSVQQGFEQMMQGIQQMADARGKAGSVKLVDYEALKGLLPEMKGWQRSGEKGQQVTMGISVSSAEAHYAKGDSTMKLEIVDTSFSQIVLAPIMMFARSNFEEKSDNGYKKGITLGGVPGFESWEKDNRAAEVHLIVGERFLVNVDANDVDSPEPARELAQAVSLSKLAALK